MPESLEGGHTALWLDNDGLAEEVDHFFIGWTVLVALQCELEVEVVIDGRFWLERLFTSADEIHYAAERPCVDLEILELCVSCLRRRPLFQASSEAYPRMLRRYLESHVQIDDFDLD